MQEALHDAKDYGFDVSIAGFDWARLKRSRDTYVRRLNGIYATNLEKDSVEVITGRGRFTSGRSIDVSGTEYTADHIAIATGGYPTVPSDLKGAEFAITSDDFFELERLPRKVAVVGAGYIAVELAGILRALGADTTLAIRHAEVLRSFDRTIRARLMEELVASGVEVLTHTSVTELESRPSSAGAGCDTIAMSYTTRHGSHGAGAAVSVTEEGFDEVQTPTVPHHSQEGHACGYVDFFLSL